MSGLRRSPLAFTGCEKPAVRGFHCLYNSKRGVLYENSSIEGIGY